MNETNGVISAEEGNYLGKDTMQSEEHKKYEESEDRDQSMDRPRISKDGTDVDRLEISFDGKYVYMVNIDNY